MAFAAVAIAGMVAAITVLWVADRVIDSELRRDLLHIASAARSQIDVREHDAFVSADQHGSPEHERILAPLRRLGQSIPDVKYIYTIRLDGDGLVFILDAAAPVDGDGDGVVDQAHVMEPWVDAPAEALLAIRTGKPTTTAAPYKDKWGSFITAFVPMVRDDGSIAGAVGVDMSVEHYLPRRSETHRALVLGLGPLAVLALAAGVGGYFRQRSEVRSRAALAESEERSRLLSEWTDDIIGLSEPDGKPLYLSPSYFRRLGWRPSDAETLDWRVRVHPDDLGAVEEAWMGVMSGSRTAVRFRTRCANGSWIWMEQSASPVVGPDGVVTQVVWSARDVTERIEAEQRVRDSENALLTLIEHVPIAMAMFDSEMRYIAASRRWLEEYNFEDQLILGQSHYELVPNTPQRWKDAHRRCLTCVVETSEEDRVENRDGTTRWLRWEVHPWLHADGGVGGLLMVTEDISARRETERLLRAAGEAAAAANQAKSDFLANMSHEIRTPMTAILGFTDLLMEPNLSEEDRRRYVGTIQQSGEHLLALINDILDISKIEAGQMTLELIPFNPARVVSDVAVLMLPRATDRQLSFNVEPDGPLPELVVSDPTRLRQVLVNLVGNAVKFTNKGGITIRVRMGETGSDGAAKMCFEVRDTGIGISEDHIKKLFQPFTQADSSTARRYGGTGLGLSICARLAEMLGGRVTVTSELGAGSVFSVEIGCGPASGLSYSEWPPDLVAGLRAVEPPSRGGSTPWNKIRLEGRILLVDDGADNRRLISHILTRAGAAVETAEDGRAAVDAVLAAEAPDAAPFTLILMDMQMPVLDGYEAVGQLRRAGCTRPIIALTANAMSGDRDKCLSAGCDDYATKPIDRKTLLETCARYAGVDAASSPPTA